MDKSIEGTLLALRLHLAAEMSEAQREEAILEAENHLRERMSALVELGLSPEAAEVEAVENFGKPGAVAKALIDAASPPIHVGEKRILRTFLLFAIVFVAFGAAANLTSTPQFLVVPFVPLVAFFVASVRHRRWIPGKLLVASVPFFLFVWLAFSLVFVNLDGFGGRGLFGIREMDGARRLAHSLASGEHFANSLEEQQKEIFGSTLSAVLPTTLSSAIEEHEFVRRATVLGLAKDGKILAPIGRYFGPVDPVLYEALAPADALSRWKSAHHLGKSLRDDVPQGLADLAAIQGWERASLGQRMLVNLHYSAIVAGFAMSSCLLLNFVGAALGSLILWIRRVRRVLGLLA